jgi:hypothetical protein
MYVVQLNIIENVKLKDQAQAKNRNRIMIKLRKVDRIFSAGTVPSVLSGVPYPI